MTSTDLRTDPDCLFCRIVAGEVPADVVATSERSIAFRDIDPHAPVHARAAPRDHHGDIAPLAAADPELLGDVVALADEVAGDLADGQFRLIFNSGPRAGQSVVPGHVHVIAGAELGRSPAGALRESACDARPRSVRWKRSAGRWPSRTHCPTEGAQRRKPAHDLSVPRTRPLVAPGRAPHRHPEPRADGGAPR